MITYRINESITGVESIVIPMCTADTLTTQLDALPEVIQSTLRRVIETKDVSGKAFEIQYIVTDTHRLFIVGCGKPEDMSLRRWKQVVGAAVLAAAERKVEDITIYMPSFVISALDPAVIGEATATAAEIANYSFADFLSGDAIPKSLASVTLAGIAPSDEMERALERGKHIGTGVNVTRQLGNTPPSVMTPTYLADAAQDLESKHAKLSVRVLEREDMKQLGMGCLLGVAQGSELPPKFIILEFMNGGTEQPTVLVGKGITFDSGGLSLKPANFMTDMKFDMLGAGTVLGTMHAVVHLGLERNIIGIIPSAENMPSGTSFRPDDILTAMNGKTVEIGNTDAEGRLILADALSYVAANYDPAIVIDFATLTGACVVALGTERSGIFSPEDDIANDFITAAEREGEWIWRLPLGEEFSEAMKSQVADISNISESRYGGASTAAAFLQFFTLDHETGEPLFPWAHFDLASAYKGKIGRKWQRSGATGDVVQTIVSYLRNKQA